MKTIRVIIERNEDGFWAYSDDVEKISGFGETVRDCKKDVMNSIETLKMMDDANRPKVLDGEYEIIYKFDIESLLSYFSGVIGHTSLSKLTGIHHKQIHHYSIGLHKPRRDKLEKIQAGLHKLGKELLAIEL